MMVLGLFCNSFYCSTLQLTPQLHPTLQQLEHHLRPRLVLQITIKAFHYATKFLTLQLYLKSENVSIANATCVTGPWLTN